MNSKTPINLDNSDNYEHNLTQPCGKSDHHGKEIPQDYIDSLIQFIQNSPSPLTTENLVDFTLQGWANVIPHRLYDPCQSYRKGQKVYHASPLVDLWFEVERVDGNKIIVIFENGENETFIHRRGQEESIEFPITPEAYFLTKIEANLKANEDIYYCENFWHNQPIPIQYTQSDFQTEQPESFSEEKLESRSSQTSHVEVKSQNKKDDIRRDPKQTINNLCRQLEIFYFFHITRIENLPGIFRRGLLCKNRLSEYEDVSNQEIQFHRHTKRIPFYPSLTLHDCVPLFFAPISPMLSVLRKKQNLIVYLFFDPMVLSLSQVTFTDGNARSNTTQFFNTLEDLSKLDWDILKAKYWSDEDPTIHIENKRRRAAEILVPDNIPASYMRGVHNSIFVELPKEDEQSLG